MNEDRELLTAVRESLTGVTLSIPLEATIHRGRKLRARRRIAGISGAAVIAIVTALTVTGLGNGSSSAPQERLAAWTVTDLPHGLIVVRISQLRDPAGLQRTLRAHGVPAAVAFQGGTLSLTPPLPRDCGDIGLSPEADTQLQVRILDITPGHPMPMATHDGRRTIALVIRPAAIPKGIGLNLTVQWSSSSWGWSLGLVRASPQCTGS
jgi:hypothetical protein